MFDIKIGQLKNATLSAAIYHGLSVTLPDGGKARLAIVDEDGNIIDDSPLVAREAFNVSMQCFKNFMIGHGHMRVATEPPGLKRTTVA